MPTLSEATTNFTVGKELTSFQPSLKHKMLEWIQNNPKQCEKTSLAQIAREALIPGATDTQKLSALYSLTRERLLMMQPATASRSVKAPKKVFINYLHRLVPKEILNNAPDGEVEAAKKVIEGISIKQEARKLLAKQEEQENQLLESVASQPAEKSTSEVNIPLDEQTLNKGFSLTLNINFTFNKEK